MSQLKYQYDNFVMTVLLILRYGLGTGPRTHPWLSALTLSYAALLGRSAFMEQPTSLEISLPWRHNERDGVSNYQPHDCLLNRLFRRRSKKTSKLRVTGLCEFRRRSKKTSNLRVTGLCDGNSPVTGEYPAQRAVTRKMFSFHDVILYIADHLLLTAVYLMVQCHPCTPHWTDKHDIELCPCFLKRHWCVTSDRNPAKFGIVTIDHLNSIMYDNNNEQLRKYWTMSLKQFRLAWFNFNLSIEKVFTSIIKRGMKLLIHSQTWLDMKLCH